MPGQGGMDDDLPPNRLQRPARHVCDAPWLVDVPEQIQQDKPGDIAASRMVQGAYFGEAVHLLC
jgi:hypothetical protein